MATCTRAVSHMHAAKTFGALSPFASRTQVELVSDAAAVKLCPYHDTVQAAASGAGAISVGVARADGSKCARCWNYSPLVGASQPEAYPDLCERCTPVVAAAGFVPQAAAGAASAGGQRKEPAVATA